MENGYKIVWTDFALEELAETFSYLETKFSDKEMKKLTQEIERILSLISQNPKLFPLSDKKKIRKVVVLKFNSLYYRTVKTEIQILSFFSNRQNPDKIKL